MTAKRILSDPDREQAARIVALFSVLIHAWMTNEFGDAAQAKDDLEAMGVAVRLPRRRSPRKRQAAETRQGVADGE